MDHAFCPGAKMLRQPKPEEILCPACGAEAEIWSDELRTTCPFCMATILREDSQSCLDWCTYGKECVGDEIYDRYMKNRALNMKDRLMAELEVYYQGSDDKIAHARAVLEHAEDLLKREAGDWHIVVPAAILHDVGIKAAVEKYGSSEGAYQEREGPPIARDMLLKMGLGLVDIDQICEIIAHHHSPGEIDTINFKILFDADSLVNLRGVVKGKTKDQLVELIDDTFLTPTGRTIAEGLFLR